MNEESKHGITLEKYIELIVKTKNNGDNNKEIRLIIENEGIDMKDWKKAKKKWEEQIRDPNDEGKTYAKFIPLYQAALERNYIGRVPCSLEEFTKIHCELSFRKDPDDPTKPMNYKKVLEENGIDEDKWEIYNSFWILRVGMPNYRKKFSELVIKCSQKDEK